MAGETQAYQGRKKRAKDEPVTKEPPVATEPQGEEVDSDE